MGFFKDIGNALSGGAVGLVSSGLDAWSQSQANKANVQMARETNASNERINQANINYQREAADTAWSRQLDMFNMQNEYNTPLAQRNRLQDAGMNPLLGGDVSSGVSSTVPSAPQAGAAETHPMQAPHVDPYDFNTLTGALGDAVMRSKLVDAQTDNLKKDSVLKDIDALTRQKENESRIAKQLSEKDLNEAERGKLGAELAGVQLQNQFLTETYEQRVEQMRLQNRVLEEQALNFSAQSVLYKIDAAWKDRLNEAQLRQVDAAVHNFYMQAAMYGSQAALNNSMSLLNGFDYKLRQDVRSCLVSEIESSANLRANQSQSEFWNSELIRQNSNIAGYEFRSKSAVPTWFNGWSNHLLRPAATIGAAFLLKK